MPPVTPGATYRIQLTKDFGFDAAAAIVPYLKALGITHLYASPFLMARPGSTHGYDIVDHDRLNPELGGDEAFYRMSDALRAHDLGLILDFVPNHMAVGQSDNMWWLDVLEWGQRSPHVASFDIDWDALPHRRHPGVLLPILGRPYGDALQAGEIELRYDAETGSFAAWYFTHKLPINPQRYSEMLRTIVEAAHAAGEPTGQALLALAGAHRNPSSPSYREAPALKQALKEMPGAAALIERGLSAYRGAAGAQALHLLLERQHYRVAYWRVAFSAINYRRFFDINDLAGIRVEDSKTFRAIHLLVARLIAEDRLQGLRLDHIDGLRDPAQYTRRLTQLVRKIRREAGLPPMFFIVVEKILGADEPIPPLPGIAGTTGYEWLNTISRVLVDDDGLPALERTWRAFTGEQASFFDMLDAAKLRAIETTLASEFTVLARALSRIAAGHFSTRDYTIDRLRAALQLYVREFPVYRTYATATGVNAHDRGTIEATIARARARWQGPDPQIFDFLRDVITLDLLAHGGYSAPRLRNFALKLQQFTGPLTAKALEDTTFYRFHRLLALNEVGGDPATPALTLPQFHAAQEQRAASPSVGLTATTTHDTKRGEDARARILALSEIPQLWDAGVHEWATLNGGLTREEAGWRTVSQAHEYMIYQTLVGVWPGKTSPELIERMQAYALKAAREGKQETSWTNPNEVYEKGLTRFVSQLLSPEISSAFLASFDRFAERTSLLGALNSLSQLALKALLPGIPDFYQGTALWDLSLVDPDNRRPVDFSVRQQFLSVSEDWRELSGHWQDGHIKLVLTRALLRLRSRHAEIFERGTYSPLATTGPDATHIIACARKWKHGQIVIAIGRQFAAATGQGTHWPSRWRFNLDGIQGIYQDALSTDHRQHTAADISERFTEFPIAAFFRV